MKFTLRQLEVFLAISQFENTGKAAEFLSMSQSACSGALKDLENQFDVALFDRVGKRIQSNELGKLLRPKVEALLDQAKELESEFVQKTSLGELKIGATLTIGNYLAVNLMTKFMHSHPQAEVKLEVANTHTIVQELLNFDIDLGLIEGEIHHQDLSIYPWITDTLCCFCSPEHPYAKIGTLNDDHLLAADWILRETGSGTRQTFDRAMSGLLPKLTIKLALQHTEGIKRAVEGNLGVSCLSEITLQDSFKRGNLVPLRVPTRDFQRTLYLVLHKHKYLSYGIQKWLDLCGIIPDVNKKTSIDASPHEA